MTIGLLVALVATVLVFAWLLDRVFKNQSAERAQHRSEVQYLLQRIQAPEVAVAQHAADHAGPDEPFPLSDEEAQEELERSRAVERIEELANSEAPWLS